MTVLIESGQIGTSEEISLPFDDPAIQFGAGGLFETIRVEHSRPHLLQAHLDRLLKSAQVWGLSLPCTELQVREAIGREIAVQSDESFYRLRLTLGPGVHGPRMFVHASPLPEAYLAPISGRPLYRLLPFEDYCVATSDPWNGHKSTQYYAYWEAKNRALQRGFDEAILMNEREEVAEGSMSNIFWMKDETLFTPARECGGLPGVFAGYLSRLCEKIAIEVQETCAAISELEQADSVFLTNSLGEIMIAKALGDSVEWSEPATGSLLARIIDAVEAERADRAEDLPTIE